uniref:Uncharacterized protein n=1 Tax=Picea glauca TaxID=3330 RepID=A0A101M1R8_PICGL|nr:hypothetical protein ABT39_MTgene3954 [Picea glauca]QHR91068.1 hypothetical protein Q903MT_gene5100 [Picea sitchensis]
MDHLTRPELISEGRSLVMGHLPLSFLWSLSLFKPLGFMISSLSVPSR